MPPEASDPAARWRVLAEDARAAAEEMTDPKARLILLTIARAYERLAERADTREVRKNLDSED
jgi:hypothetical protein